MELNVTKSLIFQETETLNVFIIFQEMKLKYFVNNFLIYYFTFINIFLITCINTFSKESFSYISGNGNPEKIIYISGNGSFLYLRKHKP